MGENRSLSNGQEGNVPKLRFPGFEGEWTKKRLSEVATGFDYGMNAAAIKFDGTNQYIRITDIDDESRCYNQSNPVSPAGILDEKYLVGVNDILFARTGASTGKSYLYKETDGKLYFAGFLIRVTVNAENNSIFVFNTTLTQKYNKWVQLTSMRSGQPGINSQEYASYTDFYPMLNEQNKIAKFLNMFELRISKQRQLIETLKKYKRGVIKSLFERKRIISCKESQWKKCYMGDVITLQSGQDFVPSDYNDNGTGIPYMTGASCIVDDKTVVSRWTTKPRCMAYKDDTLLVCKGSGSGAVVKLTQKEAHIARQFMALQCNSAITKDFCFYLTLYLSNRIKQAATGLIEGIDRKTVLNQEIMLPSIDEQNKIANFLSNYDNIIYAHKTYLAYINEIKKHLLQQLFI